MGASEKRSAAHHPGDGPGPRTPADVIAAEEQRIRDAVDFDRHCDECIGEINGMRRALRVLAAAGMLATAERDRGVAAQALREAASDVRDPSGIGPDWLRARAAILVARGDAAPREVEWGVRYSPPKGGPRITHTDHQSEVESAAEAKGDARQGAVSAWREAQR